MTFTYSMWKLHKNGETYGTIFTSPYVKILTTKWKKIQTPDTKIIKLVRTHTVTPNDEQ